MLKGKDLLSIHELSVEDVEEILQVHVMGGGRVRRLMLTEKDVPPPKA